MYFGGITWKANEDINLHQLAVSSTSFTYAFLVSNLYFLSYKNEM